jgi:hypothetical protein
MDAPRVNRGLKRWPRQLAFGAPMQPAPIAGLPNPAVDDDAALLATPARLRIAELRHDDPGFIRASGIGGGSATFGVGTGCPQRRQTRSGARRTLRTVLHQRHASFSHQQSSRCHSKMQPIHRQRQVGG